MPYIETHRRYDLLDDETRDAPETPGELNFLFSMIAYDYWRKRGNYQAINDILGALEGAKLEFYRRIVEPYEDNKISENGDVYD